MNRWRIACVVAALGAGGLVQPALAQVNPKFAELAPEIETLRTMMRQDRRTVIGREMKLSDGQSQAFWKIYDEYQAAMQPVHDRLVKLITDYGARFESMDDAQATRLTRDYFAVKQGHFKTREKYAKKIAQVLSPIQAARFVQIEGRMDLVRDMSLARQIPLIHEMEPAPPH